MMALVGEDIQWDLPWTNGGPFTDSSEESHLTDKPSSPCNVMGQKVATLPRRKPIPRKGHTKSRRGCFACKKRKVKCQETWPKCANCEKIGMICEYPNPPAEMRSTPPIIQLQPTPTTFTMKDMQFFHYFLTRGYPHLPVGADNIWTLEVPTIAHEVRIYDGNFSVRDLTYHYKYDFLLHSMLGLGASHLALSAPSQSDIIGMSALSHRVEAIKRLNKALHTPAKDKYDADARFAALMLLTFQSSCLPDGLVDFLTMLRGCILHGKEVKPESFFVPFLKDNHVATMNEKLQNVSFETLDPDLLDQAMASLTKLRPYCSPGVELVYHEMLVDGVQAAHRSPRDGEKASMTGNWCL
jgi:Zn(2)-Cys(6) binuclear cluster domain-containing protein/transcription factor-like protein